MKRLVIFGLIGGLIASLVIMGSPHYGEAAKIDKWRAQTCVGAGRLFDALVAETEHVRKMTGGRLDIKIYPVGAFVGITQMLEAVGQGVYEANLWQVPAYYAGLEPGLALLFSIPSIWTDPGWVQMWYYYFGGKELYEPVFAKYNVYLAGIGTTGAEPFLSKKPIHSLKDFKGLKIRTPLGLTAAVFEALGALPTQLPSSEIYSALDTGVIDGAEWASISDNYDQGLHEVAPNILYPSFHSPTTTVTSEVNMDRWKKLPDDLKACFEGMMARLNDRYNYEQRAANYDALKKMIEKGCTHTTLSSEDMAKVRSITLKVLNGYKAKSPLSAKAIDSLVGYWKLVGLIE